MFFWGNLDKRMMKLFGNVFECLFLKFVFKLKNKKQFSRILLK